MNKYISLGTCAVAVLLQTACNSGSSGGTTPAPNSITASSVVINANWSGGSTPIQNITNSTNSGLSAVNASGVIWQADYVAGQTTPPEWESLPALPDAALAATTAVASSGGILYAASTDGAMYSYNSSNWDAHSTTGQLNPTTMVITGTNRAYLGNAEHNLWYYDGIAWSDNLSAGGFSTTDAITQVILDSSSNPQYLGVATGAYAWACQLSNGGSTCTWENMVQTAIDNGWYTDEGSFIGAMGFYQTTSGTQYDYGYIGNDDGHVWRAIYQTSTGTVNTFDNMNTQFPGFPAGAGAITSLAVDANNNVYAGTANGFVEIWTTGTTAWNNITPTGSSNPVTALSVVNSTGTNGVLVAGNATGQMWSIDWE